MRRHLLGLLVAAALGNVGAACAGEPPLPPSDIPRAAAADGATVLPAPREAGTTEAGTADAAAAHAASGSVSTTADAATAADAETGAPSAQSARQLVGDSGADTSEWKVGGGQATMTGGSRTVAIVQPTLDANLPAVARCYGPALKRNHQLKGLLRVKITIEPDGAVSSAADDGGSEVTDAELLKCVLATYKKLKFPRGTPKTKDTAVFRVVFGPET